MTLNSFTMDEGMERRMCDAFSCSSFPSRFLLCYKIQGSNRLKIGLRCVSVVKESKCAILQIRIQPPKKIKWAFLLNNREFCKVKSPITCTSSPLLIKPEPKVQEDSKIVNATPDFVVVVFLLVAVVLFSFWHTSSPAKVV